MQEGKTPIELYNRFRPDRLGRHRAAVIESIGRVIFFCRQDGTAVSSTRDALVRRLCPSCFPHDTVHKATAAAAASGEKKREKSRIRRNRSPFQNRRRRAFLTFISRKSASHNFDSFLVAIYYAKFSVGAAWESDALRLLHTRRQHARLG